MRYRWCGWNVASARFVLTPSSARRSSKVPLEAFQANLFPSPSSNCHTLSPGRSPLVFLIHWSSCFFGRPRTLTATGLPAWFWMVPVKL
ncbi:hypothetical protein PISMIDRAFT_688279 [Pisolithus microcarpus 441]|uniref:Uncharacterized protein n=1 Tax=Pisolithus microcarpus 441 TaxID=765257 RepID=A0A0C9YJE3_9AGAM|nr:hypothetical protein PISMIDRAFT_688279 [Pisolithus microcarpus 441]